MEPTAALSLRSCSSSQLLLPRCCFTAPPPEELFVMCSNPPFPTLKWRLTIGNLSWGCNQAKLILQLWVKFFSRNLCWAESSGLRQNSQIGFWRQKKILHNKKNKKTKHHNVNNCFCTAQLYLCGDAFALCCIVFFGFIFLPFITVFFVCFNPVNGRVAIPFRV